MKEGSKADKKDAVLRHVEERPIAGNLNFISVNDLIQVAAADDKNPSNYYSRVNNVLKDKIVIAWPTQRGIRLPVRPDQKLIFTFLRDGIPYAFNGIAGETIREPLPQITIIPFGSIKKTQRRQNFRVKCLVPVVITGTANLSGSSGETEHAVAIKTVTVDLSAGGIGIRWSKGVPEGTLLEAKLALPDKGPVMRIPCRVAYSEQIPDNPSMYHMGMQFLAISEREQARIIRYHQRLQVKSLPV